MGVWQPLELFRLSPQIGVDQTSWMFALAVVAVLLAVNLTGASSAQSKNGEPMSWVSLAGGAAITGLSLLVMFSTNLLTTLLTWMLLDLVEFIVYLSSARDQNESEKAVIHFSTRAAGLAIGIYTSIAMVSQGLPLTYDALSPATSGLLILSICLRLGLIPNTPILPNRLPPHEGYATLLRLTTTAAHFPLLVKTAQSGASPSIQSILWIWCGITALISAASWVSSTDSQSGRYFWLMGFSSLIIASSMAGYPQAVIAMGWLFLLPGGMIFLANFHNPWTTFALSMGALAVSGLPFTPGWQAVGLFSGAFHPGWLMLLPAQSLFLMGYLLQIFKKDWQNGSAESWPGWMDASGLFILLMTTFLLSWWSLRGNISVVSLHPGLLASWPGLISLGLIIVFWFAHRFVPRAIRQTLLQLNNKFSLGALSKPIWRLFLWIRRSLLFSSSILESQSGILWALLILVLIVSLYRQGG